MALENPPQIPEERRFVWRNLEAYLAGDLSEPDRKRIEAVLCECAYTREYVQCEQQFVDAVKRCVGESPEPCPETLRLRVLEALDRCELEDCTPSNGRVARFPWPGVMLLAAACVMLAIALVMLNGGQGEQPPGLQAGLTPLVAHVNLDMPESEKCLRNQADAEYRKYFEDGPALPAALEGSRLKVSGFECLEVEGRRVMTTVYDAKDGERFALVVFSCDCLNKNLVENMQAVELKVDDKYMLLWRDGGFFRALVGRHAGNLRRHMNDLRHSVQTQ